MFAVIPYDLLLPLFASWLYVLAILLIKRSTDFGVGVYRTTFVANITSAIMFAPIWLYSHSDPDWNLFWQPLITAVLFIAGQMLTFYSLSKGDVSIATPVLGIKIILVAFFTTLVIGISVPLKLWASAALSVCAVALLNRNSGTKHHHIKITIAAAGGAACAYALFDVLVQKWAPHWGTGRFLPVMMGMVGILSLIFIPLFHAPLRTITKPAWGWLISGSFFIAAQAILFISTLAVYGKATTANIIYSSRGLWTVIAVWLVGHWFKNQEQHLGASILKWRLAGAVLMLVAIVLVLV